MKNGIRLIQKHEHKTSQWSGGTTTQLMIYPEDAQYSERNFLWRISSAKVEIEESTFTYLPGIQRIIMIINGCMTLEHEGHHSVTLAPFQQDTFMGDWTTTSVGKVTDFNLMMAEGCEGRLESIVLKENEEAQISLGEGTKKNHRMTEVFYLVEGTVAVEVQGKKLQLQEEDLFALDRLDGKELSLGIKDLSGKGMKMIHATVSYPV